MSFIETFTKFFPPPKFLTPKRAGIAISEEAVRMVEFGERKGLPTLLHYAEEKLAKDVMREGEIQNKETLREIGKKFHREFGVRFARVSIPERKTYIAKMILPNMRGNELRELVGSHLEEYVPLKSDEAVFDYKIVQVIPPKCENVEVLLSVVHRNVVEGCLSAFEETGITVTSVEIEAQSVARSVVPRNDDGTFMIVDFGSRRTGIYMVNRTEVGFTTTLDMGGETLEKLLHDKLGMEKEEISDLKNTFSCVDHAQNEENEKTAVFMSFVAAFRDEINKHVDYWKRHKGVGDGGGAIHEIILTGSESGITGLAQYLSGSLRMNVSFANVWQRVFNLDEYVPEIHNRDASRYSAAIGLALTEGT